MNFSRLLEEILAFGLRAVALWVVFAGARAVVQVSSAPAWKSYLWGLGIFVVIALMAHGQYGTHVEDADPLYGGGDVVTDFEPTDQDRLQHSVTIFTFMCLAGLPGIYFGMKDRPKPNA